jgi:hypothetical protein
MPQEALCPNTPIHPTVLAASTINGDELVVQLLRPHMPAVGRTLHPTVVRVVWPLQPTVVDAREFPDTAAVVVKLFAGAATELSRIRATYRDLL